MADIVVHNSVTLDGVMQGPGHADEDRRDGFALGGWAAPYFDPVLLQAANEGMATSGAMLFGRRTYEHFESVWSNGDPDNPFTQVLNERPKYVASRTLQPPLTWRNATLLSGDAAGTVARLRDQPGKEVVILGSGELVRSLMAHDLIDRYELLIHPLVLGSGRTMFPAGAVPSVRLRLVKTVPTTTGVIIATYVPDRSQGRQGQHSLRGPR